MRHCIYNFETSQNGDGKQCLPVVRNEWKFPADEGRQRDEQDESTEEVADDLERMNPLFRRGHASDPALSANCHANDDEQDDIGTDVGEQGNLLPCHADECHYGGKRYQPDNGGCDGHRLSDGLYCSFYFCGMIVAVKRKLPRRWGSFLLARWIGAETITRFFVLSPV
jgi:hypothetical protein